MSNHFLFIINNTAGQSLEEPLDAALTSALFDQQVDVVFIGGLENPESGEEEKLTMLHSMETCRLYHLIDNTGQKQNPVLQSLNRDELATKMNQCDRILSF